jgi:DNA polymerase-3 subunit alpha
MERLDREFSAVGFFLSGHPLDEYKDVLTSLGVKTYAEFLAGCEKGIMAGKIAGIVVSARERKSARGNPFAFVMYSDTSGQFEAVVFSDVLNASRDLLKAGTPVVVAVEAERDGEAFKMRTGGIEALESVAKNAGQTLLVKLDPREMQLSDKPPVFAEVQSVLKPGKGQIRFAVTLFDEGKEVVFKLPGKYETSPAVRGALTTMPGVLGVEMV